MPIIPQPHSESGLAIHTAQAWAGSRQGARVQRIGVQTEHGWKVWSVQGVLSIVDGGVQGV